MVEAAKKVGVYEGIVTGLAMVLGGIGAVWWAWNAPPPQSTPRPGESLVTVKVLNIADQNNSSSIAGNKNHRVAYTLKANSAAFCASGRVVNSGSDAAEVCSQEWTDIERGTWEALDALAYDARQIDVIYRTDNPTENFPVETREGPLRLTMVGLGLAVAGAMAFLFSVARLRAAAV